MSSRARLYFPTVLLHLVPGLAIGALGVFIFVKAVFQGRAVKQSFEAFLLEQGQVLEPADEVEAADPDIPLPPLGSRSRNSLLTKRS